MSELIKISDLHKSYGSLEVLKGVDLSISRGEIVAIVGASGAGKTTLLQIMGTLSSSDKGQVVIDGCEVNSLGDSELSKFRNQNIGFVFQFHHLLEEFSAQENIALPALIAGMKKNEAMDRALELLEMVNLKDRAQHKPSELSGGEQQRVAIARAMINRPAVILADEPSGNLDSKNRDEIHKVFFEMREKFNQTVVFVTHDEYLAQSADRKIVMVDGKVSE